MSAAAVPDEAPREKASIFGRDISHPRYVRWLVLLFLLGLGVRAGYLVEHARDPSFAVLTLDQKYYDTVARMLLAGEDLHQLHGLRPLLYPMFVAVCYKLGGAHGIDLALAAQLLMGVATGVSVAMLGARLFRNRLCGLAGGLLYLLAPVPLYFEGELLIESSYVFLICLVLLLHLRAAETDGAKGATWWLAGGALTVLAAQARANFLVFMAVYPLFAAWRWWRTRRVADLAPLAGLLGAAAMAVPWGFINQLQSTHFQWLPSAGGVNLYLGNKRSADGMEPEQERRVTYGERYEDSVEIWAREEYESAMRAEHRRVDTDPMAISQYWTRRALGEIRADPAAWVRLIAKKCWLMFWNEEVPNNKAFAFLRQEFFWLRWLPVRWVVLLALAPAGIWAAANRGNRRALFILLWYALLYSAANVAFFICDRYRYPVWPALAVIGGGGLVAFWEAVRQLQFRAASWMAAGMGVMALISLPNWFHARLPSFARDYFFRSIAWYEKGHFPEAWQDIQRSLALDPGEVSALHHRGNVLLALNRFDEAQAAYQQALQLAPEDSGLWNNLGLALESLGRTNEALQAFDRAVAGHPPSVNAFLQIALLQIRSGHPDAAGDILDRLAQAQPAPNAMAMALRSVLARRRGDAAQAESLERQARKLDSGGADWAIKQAANSSMGKAR